MAKQGPDRLVLGFAIFGGIALVSLFAVMLSPKPEKRAPSRILSVCMDSESSPTALMIDVVEIRHKGYTESHRRLRTFDLASGALGPPTLIGEVPKGTQRWQGDDADCVGPAGKNRAFFKGPQSDVHVRDTTTGAVVMTRETIAATVGPTFQLDGYAPALHGVVLKSQFGDTFVIDDALAINKKSSKEYINLISPDTAAGNGTWWALTPGVRSNITRLPYGSEFAFHCDGSECRLGAGNGYGAPAGTPPPETTPKVLTAQVVGKTLDASIVIGVRRESLSQTERVVSGFLTNGAIAWTLPMRVTGHPALFALDRDILLVERTTVMRVREGKPLWTLTTAKPIDRVFLSNGALVVIDGLTLTSVDVVSGAQRWQKQAT